MKNYWFQDIAKAEFMEDISKGLNLIPEEIGKIDALIKNSSLRYYILFESNELKAFLKYDGDNAVFPTQVKLSSSVYDKNLNQNSHILVLKNQKDGTYVGQATFTEDFTNKKLYNGKDEILGFDFSDVDEKVDVFPPLGAVVDIPQELSAIC